MENIVGLAFDLFLSDLRWRLKIRIICERFLKSSYEIEYTTV
jgi:hypothetical protein